MARASASISKKAVILAAGKSSKFFPPLYDRPKGLFEYKGEVLIERQIRQLQEAGVSNITVVIGYEKERFFYLADKFGVNLVVSTKYNDESNLSSLDIVRDRLGDSYLCCADHWYAENPFMGDVPTKPVRLVAEQPNASHELVVNQAPDGALTNLRSGATSGLCMVGYAYLTQEWADKFFQLYDDERSFVGMKSLLWEQFWGRHAEELPLYGIPAPEMREFDSLANFADDPEGMLRNVSNEAVTNICRLLDCEPTAISDIKPLNKGLTNVSFSFIVDGSKYVYRHPGASSNNLVNRKAEVIAQRKAVKLGIDSSVIAIKKAGWKLSRYVDSSRPFSYETDLAQGIAQIRAFHESGETCAYQVDLLSEGERLMKLASAKKGDLMAAYGELHAKLVRLWHFIELDSAKKVLCHNDTYAVNWIVGDDALCLIDWEYAGMNDPMNDLATLTVRDGLSQETADHILELYLQRKPNKQELRHYYGIMALCGWYWFSWSLFKDTLAEDGFFMLPSWRALNKYLPLALSLYEGSECS